MKDWIKQRIQNLEWQLQDPECNHPSRVEAKLEAFNEMLIVIEKNTLVDVNINPDTNLLIVNL